MGGAVRRGHTGFAPSIQFVFFGEEVDRFEEKREIRI